MMVQSKKVNTSTHLLYTSSLFQSQREGRGSQPHCALLLHLHQLAAPDITATKPDFKLHPLPCRRLGIGIDSLWRNYSSASLIYCRDKIVGTFVFGGISGKASGRSCRREKDESPANERNTSRLGRWIGFWIRHGAVKNCPLLWFHLSQPFKLTQ